MSLRRKLFAHVQQMPIAFFGRVQTGALVNRLVTDATGARSAFTEVLSNVVGNTITVTIIIAAMFALSWRITLVALVMLPLFMLPARLWGRRIQAITREGYEAGAAMSSVMVERFNVAGAIAQPAVRTAAGGRAHLRGARAAALAGGHQGRASTGACSAPCCC